jgi:hypothetical protein
LRHVEGRGVDRNRNCLAGIEGLNQTAAQQCAIFVHHGYRDLANELAEIRLR